MRGKKQVMGGESGRSMVETLGVLAIMGLLAIGGVMAYRYAVTKYQANELIEGVKQRAIIGSEQLLINQSVNLSEFPDKILGYKITAKNGGIDDEPGFFCINVDEVPQQVCQQILNMKWKWPKRIFINLTDEEKCPLEKSNMTFLFTGSLDTTDSECDPGYKANRNGTCIPTFCHSFNSESIHNTCRICNQENGQILNKENGTTCSINDHESICEEGECKIACSTQEQCGGSNSPLYCHYDIQDRLFGVYSLNPTDGYCVSRNFATRPSIPDAPLKGYKISKTKMSFFDAKNFCESWGMHIAPTSYFDNCQWKIRQTCVSHKLKILGQLYGNDVIWVADRISNSQNPGITMGSGWMDSGIHSSAVFTFCIDDTVSETPSCDLLPEAECQQCHNGEITYLPDGTECALGFEGGGICQSGICERAGSYCNSNADCTKDSYCRYIKFENHQPVALENGYMGICQIALERTKKADKAVSTSYEEMDWWSANNFCQALGLQQLDAWVCPADRFCHAQELTDFYDNFGIHGHWCGKGCQVSYSTYISPSGHPDNSLLPYCF